jgi:hypothetical protein
MSYYPVGLDKGNPGSTFLCYVIFAESLPVFNFVSQQAGTAKAVETQTLSDARYQKLSQKRLDNLTPPKRASRSAIPAPPNVSPSQVQPTPRMKITARKALFGGSKKLTTKDLREEDLFGTSSDDSQDIEDSQCIDLTNSNSPGENVQAGLQPSKKGPPPSNGDESAAEEDEKDDSKQRATTLSADQVETDTPPEMGDSKQPATKLSADQVVGTDGRKDMQEDGAGQMKKGPSVTFPTTIPINFTNADAMYNEDSNDKVCKE